MYKAWPLWLAMIRLVHCKWCDAEQDNQCIINVSKHSPPESNELSYNGNVLITKGCQITADSSLRIDATGTVTVEQSSSLSAKGDVTINGSSVFIHQSSITSSAWLQFVSSTSADGNTSLGLEVIDSNIQGARIDVSSNSSAVTFDGNSSLLVTDAKQQLLVRAARFLAKSGKAKLVAKNIQISALGDLALQASVPGVGTKEKVIPTNLELTTQGDMSLGNRSVTWSLSRLNASANNLQIVPEGQVRVDESDTCRNTGGSRVEDRCVRLMGAWPAQSWAWPPSADDGNVTFDLVLMAKSTLYISANANLQASSALICGQDVVLNDQCVVDVSGAGCPAASMSSPQSHGGVSLPGPPGAPWLAGGGTHVGGGGYALWSDSSGAHVFPSTVPAHAQYDRYNETRDVLPTQGASGGATGIAGSKSGGNAVSGHSSGGGLIWVSGFFGITFGARVRLDASGTSGIAAKDKNNHFASGGGSGGQILIFSGPALKAPEDQDAPVIKASGGDGACTSHGTLWVVSGAGGGGFVGFNWSKPGGHWAGPGPSATPESLLVRPSFEIMVNGGALGSDDTGHGCNLIPGREMLDATYGRTGQNMSISACPGGHAGVFCDLCDKDSWSDGLGVSCLPCNKIPAKAYHPNTTDGWSGPNCPYSCSVGLPNVASNPDCLDPLDYALAFFGGWKGVLAIVCAIVATALLLLWRRRKSAGMTSTPLLDDWSNSSVQRSGTSTGPGTSSRVRAPARCARLLQCFTGTPNEFQINREDVPFHLCRVYFAGDNSRDAPWLLLPSVPPGLEEVVVAQRWQQMVQQVNKATEVPGFLRYLDPVVRRLYPPLAPRLGRWQRRQRAQRVAELLEVLVTEPLRERLWTEIREPGKELVVRFGCDPQATLAHFDFFDYSRCRQDWVPVNLLKDAWLIPVHGQGTFAEPFEVDVSDPVLQLLHHTEFGETPVLSVMSTFNRAARRIQQDDLYKDEDDLIKQLHDTVDQCAAQCGLANCVQPYVIATSRRGPRSTSARSSDGSIPSPSGAMQSQVQEGSENSFMDLVEQGQSPSITSRYRRPRRAKQSELRLCLVFTQFSALPSLVESGIGSDRDSGETSINKVHALTTPMSMQAFNELLRCSAGNIGEGSTSMEAGCSSSRGLQRLLLKWARGSEGAAARTLVSLTCLLALDLMVFSLVFWILWKTSTAAGLVWFLLPPLAQPLALVFGLLFLITEDPDIGRFFADLELFSMWNAVFALLVLLVLLLLDSFLFDVVAMGVVVCVKAMLFASAAAHVSQLKAGKDLSFISAPQGEFVAGFFARATSRRSQASSNVGLDQQDGRNKSPLASTYFNMSDAMLPRDSSVVTPTNSFPITRCSSRSAQSPRGQSSSRQNIQAPPPASPF